MRLAFVDTETTGLDPDRHEIWEVGLVLREYVGGEFTEEERHWFLKVDLGKADAVALKIGKFHQRYEPGLTVSHALFAEEFAALTRGAHLVGAVISFDEERLRKLLRANGACPEWHYHLVDVEALAAGAISEAPPWDSDELSAALGIKVPEEERHTALGDARWARDLYDAALSEQANL